MRFAVRLASAVAVSAACFSGSAWGWSKSYVVEWFEPAFYYGADHGDTAPGTDCPKGTNPAIDKRKVLKTSYRTWAEIDKLLDPENPQWNRIGAIRGPNKENVYETPWAIKDPGMVGVTGNKSFGFDLDGDAHNGFSGVNGGGGIDNNYYKAAGCWMAWRGPDKTSLIAKYTNEYMQNGEFTVVIVISGEGADPDNDPNARVAFYLSTDKLVKDANGGIAGDFSFRVNTDPRYQSVIEARTVKGVVESRQPADIQLHDTVTASFFPPQLKLFKGQLRFEKNAAGRMAGMIGGYRSIEEYYTGWAAAGTIHESVTRIDIPAYWYALHRNADYKIDPKAQENDAISTAYRFFLLPAFVISPDGKSRVEQAQLFPGPVDEKLSRKGRPMPPAARPTPAAAAAPTR